MCTLRLADTDKDSETRARAQTYSHIHAREGREVGVGGGGGGGGRAGGLTIIAEIEVIINIYVWFSSKLHCLLHFVLH